MNINDNLNKLIRGNKLNITKIAKESEVHRSVIHKILDGTNENPGIKTVKKLADYFGITIDELIR